MYILVLCWLCSLIDLTSLVFFEDTVARGIGTRPGDSHRGMQMKNARTKSFEVNVNVKCMWNTVMICNQNWSIKNFRFNYSKVNIFGPVGSTIYVYCILAYNRKDQIHVTIVSINKLFSYNYFILSQFTHDIKTICTNI